MNNLIIDPQTKKQVDIHSEQGKSILKKYVKQYKSGGFFWPFVKTISKEAVDNYSPIELFFKTRGDFCEQDLKDISNDCDNNILETLFDLKSAKEVGKGTYGSVFKICYNKAIKSLYRGNNCYALKVMKIKYSKSDIQTETKRKNDDNNFKNEINMQCNFSKLDFAPKIYAAWKCSKDLKDEIVNSYYIIMELVTPVKRRLTQRDGMHFLNKLREGKVNGLLHVDTHPGNIALKNNKLILIDFGWSVKLGDGIGKNKDRYPEYPAFSNVNWKISGIKMLLDKGPSWNILEIMQDHNLYYFFGNPNKDKEDGVFYDILPIGTPANKLKDRINEEDQNLYLWSQTLSDLKNPELDYDDNLKNYRAPWDLTESDWKHKIDNHNNYYQEMMNKIKLNILKYQEEKSKIEATRTIQNAWRNKRFSPSIGVIESKKN